MNLLENESKDVINDYEKCKDFNLFLKLILVITLGMLIYKCNEFNHYKKAAESKMLRDSASVESYKTMLK